MTNDVKPPQPRPLHRDKLALLLLVGGGLAWFIVLTAVGIGYLNSESDGGDPAAPDAPDSVIGEAPGAATLAAVTPTPRPTVTPSVVPNATRTAAPTAARAAATATPQSAPPSATPAPDAADDPAVAEAAEPGDSGDAPGDCALPEGWDMYVVQPDDTLFAFELGSEGAVTVEDIMAANCLDSRYLLVDQVIYLPPGAAENAPPSSPYVPGSDLFATGGRTPNCPCTIRISEGWRREQIAEAVQGRDTRFTGGDFLAVTGTGVTTPFDFANQRPAGTTLEGLLFPGVYTVQNDTSAEQFRDMLLAAFDANIPAQMRADALAQGVSFYEVVIIASIVQREVRGPENQKNVASVIYNRHRAGSRLGATVTLQYPLGEPGNWWPRVTNINFESPYNTYNRTGLPPTPIDNPGLTALLAAIYPPQTNYYYHNIACDGSGEVFSETYEQHLATVNCE
jgi:hypothetical protein